MESKKYLLDFLNNEQIMSLKSYNFISHKQLTKNLFRTGDYIKFMYKYNFKFMEGGIIMDISLFPVVKLMAYNTQKSLYNIDLSQVYVFHKKNLKKQTQRQFFEDLLESLKKK